MAQERNHGDLRIENVTLFRLAKKETGTLTLDRHHLIFSYFPSTQTDRKRERGLNPIREATSTSSNGVTALRTPTSDSARESVAEITEPSSTASELSKAKPRQKTVWIAYPMINSCVLRPSHSRNINAGAHVSPQAGDGTVARDGDELFPPTFGTSPYGRPSTDSSRLPPYSSPRRPASPMTNGDNFAVLDDGRAAVVRIRCKDFKMFAFHFSVESGNDSPDEVARRIFFALRSRCCVDNVEDLLAFHFKPPPEEMKAGSPVYDARREFARMGIGSKAAEGHGSAWRITDINKAYGFSPTYPSVLCVPRAVSDNTLKYGGEFRSKRRIPTLTYLHFNGGSITRSAQPMVGLKGKRSPQDERLVSAIFCSHTPPEHVSEDTPSEQTKPENSTSTSIDFSASDEVNLDDAQAGHFALDAADEKDGASVTTKPSKIYGSQRSNLLVDARPRINAYANRATGGGIEDISNYQPAVEVPIERIFLSIPNIHVMRASLERVVESFANSDYINFPPDQEGLRRSGWLGHIAAIIDGAWLVARTVGLSGSHALIHCSDGWDRTAQVSGLAQIMLDPHYRTLSGFIMLVQKDFLSFGHKFNHRNGIQGCEKWFEIENERVMPARGNGDTGSDTSSLNALGSKALTGARNWFEKSRGNLFRQQNSSRDSIADSASSRPASPPPNSILHSPASTSTKDDKDHKNMEKEIAPIFHQFLDAVYQLLRQKPNEFEYNEKFLIRLFYHSYAAQYGEFIFNHEQQRAQHAEKTPSVWAHFLARKAEFTNLDYSPQPVDALLMPECEPGPEGQAKVRWWAKLFGRSEEQMNVPQALAPADPPSMNMQPSSMSLNDAGLNIAGSMTDSTVTLRPARSSPSLVDRPRDSTGSNFSMLSASQTPASEPSGDEAQRASITHQDTDEGVLLDYARQQSSTLRQTDQGSMQESGPTSTNDRGEADGDPLGVTKLTSASAAASRLDNAAFASQNALSER